MTAHVTPLSQLARYSLVSAFGKCRFESGMRSELSRRQVLQGLRASGFVSPAVSKAMGDAYFERREIQWRRLSPRDFESRVQVTDADVAEFYNANKTLFQSTEQADVEYVVLDLDAVARGRQTGHPPHPQPPFVPLADLERQPQASRRLHPPAPPVRPLPPMLT